MTEADEVARTMLIGYTGQLAKDGGSIPSLASARRYVQSQYEDEGGWEAWLSHQMLDNIAESLYATARDMCM